MDENTTIMHVLYTVEEQIRYDAACKRLLSEKAILARIMKTCLVEYKDYDVREIETFIEGEPQISESNVLPDGEPLVPAFNVPPDGEGSLIEGMDTVDKTVHEGAVTYDIRFKAVVPGEDGEWIVLIINVEPQGDFYPGYPLVKRGMFYCGRMLSSQYGREFVGSHYEKLKKVYSIWICLTPPKNRWNTITRYHMAEENVVGRVHEHEPNYDLLSVIMVCLGGPDGDNYEGLLRMLDVLLTNRMDAEGKKGILQDEYDIQMTRKLESEVAEMDSLLGSVARKMADEYISEGKEKGIAEGKEKGIAEGREKGIAEGIEIGVRRGQTDTNLAAIDNMMKAFHITDEQAMTVLKIPEYERSRYRELRKKQ